jgi:glycosyltransferase involved in cell wall biosynthesis
MNSYNTPLISICIPSYKNPQLLTRCLKSILDQTYDNLEVIITDDSPNQDVADVVKNYEDPRICYVKNLEPLGSPENWNEGLRRSKGEYIKIMHHDDWFASNDALEKYVSTAIKSNADFICSNCYNVRPDKKEKHTILGRFQKRWSQNSYLILYANYLGNPSTILFKRYGNKPVFYDIKSIWYVDVLFYYEFTKIHPKVAYIKDFLIDTSAGLDSQVTNSAINAKIGISEFLYVAEKHGLYKKNNILTKLSLIEILKRYDVTSKKQLEEILGASFDIALPFYLLKLPIHHQFFNIIKHFLILF